MILCSSNNTNVQLNTTSTWFDYLNPYGILKKNDQINNWLFSVTSKTERELSIKTKELCEAKCDLEKIINKHFVPYDKNKYYKNGSWVEKDEIFPQFNKTKKWENTLPVIFKYLYNRVKINKEDCYNFTIFGRFNYVKNTDKQSITIKKENCTISVKHPEGVLPKLERIEEWRKELEQEFYNDLINKLEAENNLYNINKSITIIGESTSLIKKPHKYLDLDLDSDSDEDLPSGWKDKIKFSPEDYPYKIDEFLMEKEIKNEEDFFKEDTIFEVIVKHSKDLIPYPDKIQDHIKDLKDREVFFWNHSYLLEEMNSEIFYKLCEAKWKYIEAKENLDKLQEECISQEIELQRLVKNKREELYRKIVISSIMFFVSLGINFFFLGKLYCFLSSQNASQDYQQNNKENTQENNYIEQEEFEIEEF